MVEKPKVSIRNLKGAENLEVTIPLEAGYGLP
jgi:hypothetical protein